MNYLQTILTAQLQQLAQRQRDTFPPYNIIKRDDYNYQIEVALAGYQKSEIDITHKDCVIQIERMVEQSNQGYDGDQTCYVYRGIAKRNFRLNFPVSEYMVVRDASMNDGMLVISMQLLIPEHEKPKTITIS